ncbi:MAG: hypothetical protein V3S29_07990 [bacterium]
MAGWQSVRLPVAAPPSPQGMHRRTLYRAGKFVKLEGGRPPAGLEERVA